MNIGVYHAELKQSKTQHSQPIWKEVQPDMSSAILIVQDHSGNKNNYLAEV